MTIEKQPIVPERVRKIDGGFSFIPHTFVTRRFFTSLTQQELLLYFLLVLVGDRQGLSYYSQDKLCIMLRMSLDQLIVARNSLIEKSLIAFDGFMFQVLSLPEKPVLPVPRPLRCQEDFERDDPLTIRKLIWQSLNQGGDSNDD
jgi:hypothetical protein